MKKTRLVDLFKKFPHFRELEPVSPAVFKLFENKAIEKRFRVDIDNVIGRVKDSLDIYPATRPASSAINDMASMRSIAGFETPVKREDLPTVMRLSLVNPFFSSRYYNIPAFRNTSVDKLPAHLFSGTKSQVNRLFKTGKCSFGVYGWIPRNVSFHPGQYFVRSSMIKNWIDNDQKIMISPVLDRTIDCMHPHSQDSSFLSPLITGMDDHEFSERMIKKHYSPESNARKMSEFLVDWMKDKEDGFLDRIEKNKAEFYKKAEKIKDETFKSDDFGDIYLERIEKLSSDLTDKNLLVEMEVDKNRSLMRTFLKTTKRELAGNMKKWLWIKDEDIARKVFHVVLKRMASERNFTGLMEGIDGLLKESDDAVARGERDHVDLRKVINEGTYLENFKDAMKRSGWSRGFNEYI
jgi:hypothetical protein